MKGDFKIMKIFQICLLLLIFLVANCNNLVDSENPDLINDREAKRKVTLAVISKCSNSGGSFGNIATVQAFVNVLFSATNTIAAPDRSGLYYKKSSVNNCVLTILSYNPPTTCDFNDIASLDYISNKKLCNLKPDRSIKLNIISTN
jgi:small lipoprotein (TIGR04452 family)